MDSLAKLCAEVATCQRCGLAKARLKAVPGEGPPDPPLMFIGEAPGWHENQQGRPFVGPAGQLLEELLASIGLRREEVYITNVVKCRPPNNRDPLPAEMQACADYLERQVALIKPKVIVTLGRYSTEKYFPGEQISKVRGQPRRMGGRVYFPMYHPAAALHQPRFRGALEEDIRRLGDLLSRLVREPPEAPSPSQPPEEIQQLKLF